MNTQTQTAVTTATATSNALSSTDKVKLRGYETAIQKHFETFAPAGRALVGIRDDRLYRDQYSTFEEYCRGRWDMSKTQANRLIAGAKVVDNLQDSPALRQTVSHLTESAVRPLTSLKPETQKKVLSAAIAQAPTSKGTAGVTAKLISRVAKEVAPKEVEAAARPQNGHRRNPPGDLVRKSEIYESINAWAKAQRAGGKFATMKPDAVLRSVKSLIKSL